MNFSAKRFAKEVNSWQLKRTWLTRSLRKYLIRGGCWARRWRYRAAATATAASSATATAAAAGQVTLLHSQVGISEEEWLLFRWLRLQWIVHSNLIYFILFRNNFSQDDHREAIKSIFLGFKTREQGRNRLRHRIEAMWRHYVQQQPPTVVPAKAKADIMRPPSFPVVVIAREEWIS